MMSKTAVEEVDEVKAMIATNKLNKNKTTNLQTNKDSCEASGQSEENSRYVTRPIPITGSLFLPVPHLQPHSGSPSN